MKKGKKKKIELAPWPNPPRSFTLSVIYLHIRDSQRKKKERKKREKTRAITAAKVTALEREPLSLVNLYFYRRDSL